MAKVAIVYFSGYGHTKVQAEAVADGVKSVAGAELTVIAIDENGDISDGDWETLNAQNAIIYGSPTYMGSAPWQFKKFADASSKPWFSQNWKDSVAAGFTTSATTNGDKGQTINQFFTLSQQHGQIWVGTGLKAPNAKENGPKDTNWTGGYGGALAIAPSDSSPEEFPAGGDIEAAKALGARVAEIAAKLHG